MRIDLKTEPRGDFEKLELRRGITIEELYKERKEQLPYTVLAAKVDNRFEDLTFRLEKDCRVELLDMRTQAANLIYQYSLSLIYLKAVSDCLGDVGVEIQNSLNKGMYTEIKAGRPITAKEVRTIEKRMHEIIEEDIPFVKEIVSREEAMRIFEKEGRVDKQKIMNEALNLKKVKFYSLGGVRDFFYGLMVPSSGYIEHFQLMKYRRGVLVRFPHPSNPRPNSRIYG